MTDTSQSRQMMEYDALSKSAVLAYILWFFLGFLGAHRLYSARVLSGILQFLLWGLGWLTMWILIGWAFWALWALWWVIDAVLIPGWIRDYNLSVARRISTRAS
ncbi:TM2 domain-containing protein [Microbaculum marinisediminis]|uniref:TM2 domain-containing protein n=1 Tax=Microbaculum marinisediminis TaxID=2931392 RepID=A0AAW5QY97_9HYPH|nr:TM2 domain-containing protein [Microbaculum sp. A6E488]MCT8972112.1 TM2 domain-containing protein [Microbaculum sp. A6E488]